MQFTPKTEKEIAEIGLWPEGIYDFEIIPFVNFGANNITTCDTKSRQGNEMIQLVVNIYNNNGENKTIIDYLLEKTMVKLRNASEACGLLKHYEQGQIFANDFIGKKGQVRVGVEKDTTGKYPDKNRILGYVIENTPAILGTPDAPLNDEIPF